MKLSAPIYRLKRKARRLSRQENIPLHQALDRVAFQEGYQAWSLLAAKLSSGGPAGKLFARLRPGDLLLVSARPGQGKTLLALELAVEAMRSGHRIVFFTLEYRKDDVRDHFHAIGSEHVVFDELFACDDSDEISAAYIMRALASAPRGTLAVVDYLQLLDQRRKNPELGVQVTTLKSFARVRGLIIVFISQIDRSYDSSKKPMPDIRDVRLPNPLDLQLFNKTCFLNRGEIQFLAAK
jgi:replicative DNA helicase